MSGLVYVFDAGTQAPLLVNCRRTSRLLEWILTLIVTRITDAEPVAETVYLNGLV